MDQCGGQIEPAIHSARVVRDEIMGFGDQRSEAIVRRDLLAPLEGRGRRD